MCPHVNQHQGYCWKIKLKFEYWWRKTLLEQVAPNQTIYNSALIITILTPDCGSVFAHLCGCFCLSKDSSPVTAEVLTPLCLCVTLQPSDQFADQNGYRMVTQALAAYGSWLYWDHSTHTHSKKTNSLLLLDLYILKQLCVLFQKFNCLSEINYIKRHEINCFLMSLKFKYSDWTWCNRSALDLQKEQWKC